MVAINPYAAPHGGTIQTVLLKFHIFPGFIVCMHTVLKVEVEKRNSDRGVMLILRGTMLGFVVENYGRESRKCDHLRKKHHFVFFITSNGL